MEQSEYERNCTRMQEKMVSIMQGLISKMQSTKSPIEYLVALSKFNHMMDDLGNSFATLANIEFKKLQEQTPEGSPIIVSGATIKEASDIHSYEYPEAINIVERALKEAKEVAKADGSAKKGDKRNKRDFVISLPK